MSTFLSHFPPNTPPPVPERLRQRVGWVYALQLAGFFTGITFYIAAFLNWPLQTLTRGSWLAAHVQWQWQTFMGASLGSLLGMFTLWLGFGWLWWFITSLWVMYRIIKGGYYWYQRRPLP